MASGKIHGLICVVVGAAGRLRNNVAASAVVPAQSNGVFQPWLPRGLIPHQRRCVSRVKVSRIPGGCPSGLLGAAKN
jgi:hypothetical protein